MNDDYFMSRALKLATLGLGTTWPNPMVGAVLVKNGKIIGEGYHEKKGLPHAEVMAIKNATEDVTGSTLYVTLEPCCHTNKTTPPCTQKIIDSKINEVVVCNLDPNPEVNGKGVQFLESQGVVVRRSGFEKEGEKLNEVFFLAQRKKRPFIHFKTATTLDGFTSTSLGESQWITGETARSHAHQLRSQNQAILIGGETLRRDNPRLTVRLSGFKGAQPMRIVVTKSGNLPKSHDLFTDEFSQNTLIYTEADLSFSFPQNQVIKIKSLMDVMTDLFQRNIISVLLECGPGLGNAFLSLGLIDRISLYQNPSFLGQGHSIFSTKTSPDLGTRPRLQEIESQWLGEDHYLTGKYICSLD